uniref:Uncharacterized protein n=1 Tax=Arundo donax TaxID=35708 RepID=A0A0A9CEA7_ARUDO
MLGVGARKRRGGAWLASMAAAAILEMLLA